MFQSDLNELNRRIKEAPTQREKQDLGEQAAKMFRQFFDDEYLPPKSDTEIENEELKEENERLKNDIEAYRFHNDNRNSQFTDLQNQLLELQGTIKQGGKVEAIRVLKTTIKELREERDKHIARIAELEREVALLRSRGQSAISTKKNAPQEAPAEQVEVSTTELEKERGGQLAGVVITERGRLVVEFPFATYKTLDEAKKNWLKKNFSYNPYNKSWKAKRNSVTKQALLAALML